ncbi:MAG TPA: hypothetical protein DG754_11015 [Bacteroidales bacterium]|jgi:hypothetical protein|nr:hypothetical protein [Bacteroidales bacterium]
MGIFGKSFSQELGKNTGKWASNKIFGNTGWATPRRHVIEVEQRKKQREEALEYKQHQKEIEQERREREQRLKQLEREQVERERYEMIKANEDEVREHNNYLEVIQSVHKSYSDQMDWEELQKQEAPQYVETAEELRDEITKFTNDHIDGEIRSLKKRSKLSLARLVVGGMYAPKNRWIFKTLGNKVVLGFFGLLCMVGLIYGLAQDGFLQYFLPVISVLVFFTFLIFRYGAKDFEKNVALENKLSELENSRKPLLDDNLKYQQEAHEQYLKDQEEYRKMMDIVNGVIGKNPQAYTYALNYFNPLEDLKEYGSHISFEVSTDKISVDFYVHSEDVVPNTIKFILRKGLEIKEEQLSKSRFNEIYQDYVCSCVLKIAKEIFQLLPVVNKVQVNAKGSLLNSATGNFEEQTIVSVNINRAKLNELNLDLLDPSDSMSNFEHRMDFKKNEGFKPVKDL